MTTVTVPRFDSFVCEIKDVSVKTKEDEVTKKQIIDKVIIKDCETEPTPRFWDSICSRFGFAPSIFKYFSHKEVFERIFEKRKDAQIRVTLQTTPSKDERWDRKFIPHVLGVCNPSRPGYLNPNDIISVISRKELDTRRVEYRSGIITTRHNPKQEFSFKVGDDDFESRLCLECPVDGYGSPAVYLGLIREICKNGAVAYAKAFQSSLNIDSKAPAATLQRIMEAYSNEEGFSALKQRMESAQNSYASIAESQKLAKLIWKLDNADFLPEHISNLYNLPEDEISTVGKDKIRNDCLQSLYTKTGDIRAIYGVAQIDSISKKRLQALPVKCRVYDLFNYMTEAATHWLRPTAARRLQGYFGTMIAQEYDLENSGAQWASFEDFVNPKTVPQVESQLN